MPDTVRQVPISNDRYRCDSGSCSSSPAVSPSHSFKRSKSTFYLLDRRASPPPGRLLQPQNVTAVGTVNGYLTFFWKLIKTFLGLPLVLLLRIPYLWLGFWIQLTWKCWVRIPLIVMKHILRFCFASKHRGERTVLINGGSTIQTLHLARNFYLTGAKVIICEIEGCTELSSFSIVVDKYYTIPKPNEDNCLQYVDALRTIVEKERVGFYVSTGTTVSSYYDAMAKAHLELLGCKCCTAGLDGVSILNDLSEVFRKCETEGLSVPKHLRVCSKEDIIKLYDNVSFRADKHFIVNVGLSGCKVRHSLQLPATRKSLTLPGPVSDDCPWLLVQHCPGSYYTTCTTVQNGKVIGNVTCNIRNGNAAPNELIDNWVTHFVSTLSFSFDTILTFKICVSHSRNVIPLGCRVGVPMAYTSYKSNLEKILYPPCTHQSLSPEIIITDRYYAMELIYKTITVPSIKNLVNTVLAKREMIFTYWDPLPYFVYYNLQLFTVYINNVLEKLILLSGPKNKYTTF